MPFLAAIPAGTALAISAATSVASAAIGAGVSIMQARQNVAMQNEQSKMANKVAEQNYATERAALLARQEEQRAAVSAERARNTAEVERGRGSARAAFANANLGGNALDMVLAEYARQGGEASASLGQTLRFSGVNTALGDRAAHANTVRDTVMRYPTQKVGMLPYLSGGLSILDSVGSAAGSYYGYKRSPLIKQ
jgi:hypothetical protein